MLQFFEFFQYFFPEDSESVYETHTTFLEQCGNCLKNLDIFQMANVVSAIVLVGFKKRPNSKIQFASKQQKNRID